MAQAHSSRCQTWIAWLAFLLTGCGGVRLHPVQGQVIIDDQPIADAGIMFHPQAGGPIGEAVTSSEGRFVIRCMNKPGLPAGDYHVTIVKQKSTGLAASSDGLGAGVEGPVRIEWIIPEKYSKIENAILTAKVPASESAYVFKLSRK